MPQQRGFIEIPTIVREHIRKKRMEVGLFQTDVARMFNVSADCMSYWENNRSEPQLNYYPLIIEFLGYFPWKFDIETLKGRLKEYRYRHGLSYRNFARMHRMDETNVKRIEEGRISPLQKTKDKLELLLTNKPLE